MEGCNLFEVSWPSRLGLWIIQILSHLFICGLVSAGSNVLEGFAHCKHESRYSKCWFELVRYNGGNLCLTRSWLVFVDVVVWAGRVVIVHRDDMMWSNLHGF